MIVPLLFQLLLYTDDISVSSFVADLYVLSNFAWIEYAVSSVSNIPAYTMYSSDANV
jgi:hypothetical protein